MDLSEVKSELHITEDEYSRLPNHVAGFCALMIAQDRKRLASLVSVDGDQTDEVAAYPMVACLGYAIAADMATKDDLARFRQGFQRLSGRTFFAEGRVPRFEIDGFALLGVSLGIERASVPLLDRDWIVDLLDKSARVVPRNDWEHGLVKAAQAVLGIVDWATIPDVLCRVGVKTALSVETDPDEMQLAWASAVELIGEKTQPKRAAGRAIFDSCMGALSRLPIHGAGLPELINLLDEVRDAMSHWTYETNTRVKSVVPQQWEIDHEYHVQNLLWTLLRPVFRDLVDEQSLPKVGHTTPRYDLGVPSLQTIIEVKFMRRAGAAECRKITQEIAADRSLYLGNRTGYDKLVAFIWDDCRQTEEYATLVQGLEGLEGIEKVIILPRPSRMDRSIVPK